MAGLLALATERSPTSFYKMVHSSTSFWIHGNSPKKASNFFPQLPFSVRSAYSLFRLILVFLRESMNMVQFARQLQCVVRVGL